MAVTAEKLQRELDQVASDYETHFAGQSRATRDVGKITSMIDRLKNVISQIDQLPASLRAPEFASMRDSARESLSLYEAERQAIARAKDAGPQLQQFGEFASTANFTFARYARHFAGQNRATRDPGLLAEMVEDLKACEKRMVAINKEKPSPDFQKDIDVVQGSLAQYQRELTEIAKAQAAGTPEERANLMGGLANEQFQVYGTHFAGKSRSTRRPALLQRVCDNLKRIRGEMQKIKDAGFSEEFNVKNIAIVDEQLGMYDREL